MSKPEIGRIREDLDVIRQAAGMGLPFNRREVWILTPVIFVSGVVIACMGWWVPGQYRGVALFPVAIVIGVWLCLARSSHRRRATEPARWREHRYDLLALFLFVPPFVGFIIWGAMRGTPREMIAASIAFFVGLVHAWFAVIDRTRRYYFGIAIPAMVFGLTIPFCNARQIRIGVGLMLIAMALTAAAIQVWQLRNQRRDSDAD